MPGAPATAEAVVAIGVACAALAAVRSMWSP